MDASEQVTAQFRVVSAAELPRTNFIGSIDPYFRVYLDGNIIGETRHFKNQQEPVWEEDFFFDADRNQDGALVGLLRFELYDENRTRQDEHVGSVEIDLSELPPEGFEPDGQQQIEFYDFAIAYKDDKRGEKLSRQGHSPRLTLAFLGAIPSWSALVARMRECGEEVGLLADEDSRQLYVPLPDGEGAGLYGGIQYLLPRAVHFKLVTTSKHHAGLHLDFKCAKARSLCVERVSYYRQRRKLMRGLRVHAEATLTNLPLGTDLRRLHLLATNRRAAVSHKLPEFLERAGFPADVIGSSSGSGLSYKRISRSMPAVLHDPAAASVFVPVGAKAQPYGALLQLDFREGGGGGAGGGGGSEGGAGGGGCGGSGGGGSAAHRRLAGGCPRAVLRVLALKERSEAAQGRQLVYDFMTTFCEATTTVTETHRRGVKVLGGEYQYTRSAELPGVFDGQRPEVYEGAALVGFALEPEPIASCRFAELFEPPPEEEAEGDGSGGLFDAFDPDNMPHSMGSMAVMVATTGGKMVGKAVGQLGKAVDQLGNLVGGMGLGAGGGGGGGGGNGAQAGGSGGGGSSVLRAIKAPLKLFRGGKGSEDGDSLAGRGSDNDGGGGGERSNESGRRKDRLATAASGSSVQSDAGARSGYGGSGRDRSGGGRDAHGGGGGGYGSGRDRAAEAGRARERAGGGGGGGRGSGRERGENSSSGRGAGAYHGGRGGYGAGDDDGSDEA